MTFMTRKTFTAASIALMALWTLPQAHAATQGTVIVQSGQPERSYHATQYQVRPAPPPPRHEAVPRPRRGQVWEEGHWEWRGNRYQWVRGHWVQARAGHQYRQPHWVEREGRWEFQRGGWDRDGDGVSNRHDRDRDGDGVPNRRDQQPDNPRRN
jgi:hypothetical protein